MENCITNGIHHLGLTVSKLEESADFFVRLLGWKIVRRNDEYPAIYLSDGKILLTLWAVKTVAGASFNMHKNVGLHHVAFRVESQSRLQALHQRLSEQGVSIEFSPEPLGNSAARHMMCYDPSGIRVELIWPGE
jgi:catechol 2,3-dioxygenase-like lactoylglutathione lyase family enzyme